MSNPIETMLLSQYSHSVSFMERFLDAIHTPGKSIVRVDSIRGEVKRVGDDELRCDALNYFVDNCREMHGEYFDELCESIGHDKASCFIDVIGKEWADGGRLRKGGRVAHLKASIREYLLKIMDFSDLPKGIVLEDNCAGFGPSFNTDEIERILTLNHQFLFKYLHEWLNVHPNGNQMSRNQIFFRRGICLEEPLINNQTYTELSFINSYSLAFTVTEQFSNIDREKERVLISADCEFFEKRILFFSPFIHGMSPYQLELGIIPSPKTQIVRATGDHGGINEYNLDYLD